MEKKKTKLTLSGNLKKSISNIEKAKSQGKNSVFIEKKSNKFGPKKTFNNNSKFSQRPKNPIFSKPSAPPNDYEKRKLAEQRATKRLKEDKEKRDTKGKNRIKRRELKLTISRALSGEDEGRARSLAALKELNKKKIEQLKKRMLKKS